jgi:diadenosine tetraphosphate (Ap4A) HIT family hydrolase
VVGYTLVCPKVHRANVTADFSLDEYLTVHRRVYTVAEAVRLEMNAERIYLLNLGSQQGNSHVHWHVVPLPRGVPYRQQQLALFRRDVLDIPDAEQVALAARIRERIGDALTASTD